MYVGLCCSWFSDRARRVLRLVFISGLLFGIGKIDKIGKNIYIYFGVGGFP